MNKAKLVVWTTNGRMSSSLVQALEPDNLAKRLRIKGKSAGREAHFLILQRGTIETFISTLDELLACLQAARGTLNNIETPGTKTS